MTSRTENKRSLILQAAMKCFNQKGYTGTSMDDIVRASGGSKGGIYWYFHGKEEIFVCMLEEWMQQWEIDVRRELAGIAPLDAWLRKYVDMYYQSLSFPLVRSFPEFFWTNNDSEYKERLVRCFAFDSEFLTAGFSQAAACGLITMSDPGMLAELLLSNLDGLIADWIWDKAADAVLKRKMDLTIEIFIRGIGWKGSGN